MRARLRMRRFLTTREGLILVGLVGAATLIRLPLMAFHGYYGDLAQYVSWGNLVNTDLGSLYTAIFSTASANGVLGGRGFGGGGFGGISGYVNYPPGTPYLFGAMAFLYNHLLLPSNHTALAALAGQDGLGPFFAKIPLLLADVATVALLYRQARARRSARFARLVAASWAFSPALLYNGAIWGQTDGFVALPILIALFALVSERYALAGVSLALAVVIKPQPVIFAPLVLLYLWRWSKRGQFLAFCAAGALTLLVFALPILVPHPQLADMLHNMQQESYDDGLRLTSDAFNFWWLIGDGQQPLGSAFLGLKASLVGDLFFGAVTVAVGARIWRRREPAILFFGLAVQLFGFFVFMGGQHERYLFLFAPLALAALIVAPRGEARAHLATLYALGTALSFLNMFVGVGGGIGAADPLPFVTIAPLDTYLSANFTSLSSFLAFVTLATFGYALYVYFTPEAAVVAARTPSLQARPLVARRIEQSTAARRIAPRE
jgi:hypothetical protein